MVNTSNFVPIYPALSETTTGLVTFSDKYAAGDLAFGLVLFSVGALLLTILVMFWVSRKKRKLSRKGQMKIPVSKTKKPNKSTTADGSPNMYEQHINDWLDDK